MTLACHTMVVRSCSYSPSGKQIVSASDDKTVKVRGEGGRKESERERERRGRKRRRRREKSKKIVFFWCTVLAV